MAVTTVHELMSPQVVTLRVGETLDLARNIMALGRIRHLPVVDGEGHLVGLITHRMLIGAWLGHGHPLRETPGALAREVPAEMIMEKQVATVTPATRAAEAARLIAEHKYGCLPVVQGRTLVGIVTEADFVEFARRYLEAETP